MTINEGFSWLLKLRSVYTSLVIHVVPVSTFPTIIVAIAVGIVTAAGLVIHGLISGTGQEMFLLSKTSIPAVGPK